MAWFTIHVNVTGTVDISRSLRALEKKGIAIAKAVLREKTAKMVELARAFAPREEGDLIERIHATRPSVTRDGDVVASVTAAASVIQHEDLTLNHPNGGGPKFIEKAVLMVGPEIPQALQESLDRGGPAEQARDALGRFMGS